MTFVTVLAEQEHVPTLAGQSNSSTGALYSQKLAETGKTDNDLVKHKKDFFLGIFSCLLRPAILQSLTILG